MEMFHKKCEDGFSRSDFSVTKARVFIQTLPDSTKWSRHRVAACGGCGSLRESHQPLFSPWFCHGPRSHLLHGPLCPGRRWVPVRNLSAPRSDPLVPVLTAPHGLSLQLLCAFFSGSLDAEVTQMPGYLVREKGQTAKMQCDPIKGHDYVYWYRQVLTKEFKFLISFQFRKVYETKIPKEIFSAECPQNLPCILEIQSTELQDSATYLCASSESTVVNIRSSSCTNSSSPAQEAGGVLGWTEITKVHQPA